MQSKKECPCFGKSDIKCLLVHNRKLPTSHHGNLVGNFSSNQMHKLEPTLMLYNSTMTPVAKPIYMHKWLQIAKLCVSVFLAPSLQNKLTIETSAKWVREIVPSTE